jgi:ketosteroid isomerase-like protein
MDAAHAKILVDMYIEAYNGFDVPGMLACLHPDVQFEHSTNGDVTVRLEGKAAFEAQATRAAAWFTERTQHVTAFRWQEEQDERAEVDVDYFAITATDLPNGIKVGTTLQFSGRSVFSFNDELIAFIQDFS